MMHIAIAAAIVFTVCVARAQDSEAVLLKAWAAYQAKDYAEALRLYESAGKAAESAPRQAGL